MDLSRNDFGIFVDGLSKDIEQIKNSIRTLNLHNTMAQLRYRYIGFCILFIVLLVNILKYRQLLLKNAQNSHPMIQTLERLDKQRFLQLQRNEIAEELQPYLNPNNTIFKRGLSPLIPELGGTPKKCIIISTWCTGATFMGEILNAAGGSFYHFEPLMQQGIRVLRSNSKETFTSINDLHKLLQCRYTELLPYLANAQAHNQLDLLFKRNKRLWNVCEEDFKYCKDANLLESYCKIFPVQIMKLTRLHLKLAKQLLEDRRHSARILYMVRDPRAIMYSRSKRIWCAPHQDCGDVVRLCSDLTADFRTANELKKKYPRRFRFLKFENLVEDLLVESREVFKFFDLPFTSQVIQHIKAHSEKDIGGINSTFRVSSMELFKWQQHLSIKNITIIEKQCGRAMRSWKYQVFHDRLDFKSHQ